jgi:TonB family protein
LKAAVTRSNGSRDTLLSLAQFYNRTGQFEKTMSVLEDVAAQSPTDPAAHQLVATYYWDKTHRDTTLPPEEKARYIAAGITATDRALAIKPDYVEAMVYKNILLRMQAALPSEVSRKDTLIAEADALRNRSIELQKANNKARVSISEELQPQYPPPPSTPASSEVNGLAPVRVGGNVKVPTKIKDVRPVYPLDAMDAGVSGVVIIEAVIDTTGSVHSARVLRSIPALDRAALEAVQQWRFTPTLVDGVPVPVAMTVTVNFTLQ